MLLLKSDERKPLARIFALSALLIPARSRNSARGEGGTAANAVILSGMYADDVMKN